MLSATLHKMSNIMLTEFYVHTYTDATGHSGSRQFVAQVLSRAGCVSFLLSQQERQGAWQSCISDLQRVKSLDCEVASSASCAAIFIQCQLLINKVCVVVSICTHYFILSWLGERGLVTRCVAHF